MVGILICHSMASAIIAGTVIFIAKYMENQFGITASLALFLRGSIELPLICLSFFIGGTFMSRCVCVSEEEHFEQKRECMRYSGTTIDTARENLLTQNLIQ